MSSNFSKIESLSARLVEPNRDGEEGDDEALFAKLEAEIEDEDGAQLRERGLDTVKRRVEELKEMKQNHHGQYTEISDEKEVIRVSANERRCVAHFYHSKFRRCGIMDEHLARLAPKYFSTRFLRVFVENVPWLVEKLGIKTLPCVMCFVEGVSRDRIIGFEELGNRDDFETAKLEKRLFISGVLENPVPTSRPIPSNHTGVRVSRIRDDDGDDIFDLN